MKYRTICKPIFVVYIPLWSQYLDGSKKESRDSHTHTNDSQRNSNSKNILFRCCSNEKYKLHGLMNVHKSVVHRKIHARVSQAGSHSTCGLPGSWMREAGCCPLIWFTLPWLESVPLLRTFTHKSTTLSCICSGANHYPLMCTHCERIQHFVPKSLRLSLFLSARSACISHHTREQHWILSYLVAMIRLSKAKSVRECSIHQYRINWHTCLAILRVDGLTCATFPLLSADVLQDTTVFYRKKVAI